MKEKVLAGNIHASCVDLNGAGILLLGKSGSGKSDTALRLIENKKAVLVADDRVDIFAAGGRLYASAPVNLQGFLEVRGVGIVRMPCSPRVPLKLAVCLVENRESVARMPAENEYEYAGIKIPCLTLFPFDASAPDKIVIKLKDIID